MRALRRLSTALILCGVLLLADAGLTVAWQEPVSALYALLQQSKLDDDLHQLETDRPADRVVDALNALATERRRMAFLARQLKRDADDGDAIGRIKIDRIGVDKVLVNGTATAPLRKGPGFYEETPFPGAPGTNAIAGHRTTYGAPFRRVDKLRRGDEIVITMPYGSFTYEVERTQIVSPTKVSVIDRVSFDRLVLSACHPLYSAAQRIIVFARLTASRARGAARA